MTRLRRIEELDRIFFVTFNVERGVKALADAERDLVLQTLGVLRGPDDFALFGYVIMPDHAHLLLWPRSVSLIRILRDLKSKTGFAIARAVTRTGKSGSAVILISSADARVISETSWSTSIRIQLLRILSGVRRLGHGPAIGITRVSESRPSSRTSSSSPEIRMNCSGLLPGGRDDLL